MRHLARPDNLSSIPRTKWFHVCVPVQCCLHGYGFRIHHCKTNLSWEILTYSLQSRNQNRPKYGYRQSPTLWTMSFIEVIFRSMGEELLTGVEVAQRQLLTKLGTQSTLLAGTQQAGEQPFQVPQSKPLPASSASLCFSQAAGLLSVVFCSLSLFN